MTTATNLEGTRANRRNTWLALAAAPALAATLVLAAPRAASAQDAPAGEPAAKDNDLAAERDYLQAYFLERETKAYEKAEAAYAAVAEKQGARREIVGKALVGRWRCLAALGRLKEAREVYVRIEKDYKDVALEEAQSVAPSGMKGDVESDIERLLDLGRGDDVARWGDRAVPFVAKRLRRDNPTIVDSAAVVLAQIDTDASWAEVEAALGDPAVLHAAWLANAVRRCPGRRVSVLRAALASPHEVVQAHAASAVLADAYAVPPQPLIDRMLGTPVARGRITGSDTNTDAEAALVVAALSSDAEDVRDAGISRLRSAVRPRTGHVVPPLVARLQAPPAALLAHDDSVRAAVDAIWRSGWQSCTPSPELIRAAVRVDRAAFAANLLLQTGYAAGEKDLPLFLEALRAVPERTPQRTSPWWPAPEALRFAAILGTRPPADDFRLVMKQWMWGENVSAYLEKLLDDGSLDDERLAVALSSLPADAGAVVLANALDWVSENVVSGRLGSGAVDAYIAALTRQEVVSQSAARLRVLARRPGSWRGNTTRAYATQYAALASWLGADAPRDRQDAAFEYLRAAAEAKQPNVADAVRDDLRPDHPRFPELLSMAVSARAPWVRARVDEWARTRAIGASTLAWILPTLRGADAVPALSDLVTSCSESELPLVLDSIAQHHRSLGTPGCMKLVLLAITNRADALELRFAGGRIVTEFVLHELSADDARIVSLAALRSGAPKVRAWGVHLQTTLRDPVTWDLLVTAAKEGTPEARVLARQALQGIEADRLALSTIETAARVRELLRAKGAEERRAGIAGAVATRATTLVPDLLRLAVEDADPAVRADARTALMALGTVAPAAPAAATPAEK